MILLHCNCIYDRLFSTEARETTVELTARCNGAGRYIERASDVVRIHLILQCVPVRSLDFNVYTLSGVCLYYRRRVRELETQVNALESSKAAVQATLEKTLHKLKSLEQTRKV